MYAEAEAKIEGAGRESPASNRSNNSNRNTSCRPTRAPPPCSCAERLDALRRQGQELSRFHRGHRRQRPGLRPPASAKDAARSGEPAAHFKSLLPPLSRAARRASGEGFGAVASLLLQHRNGGQRGRAETRSRVAAPAGARGKTEFVALVNSFHGRTMGALSITEQEKYRKPFEPLIPGVRFIDPNNGANDFAEARGDQRKTAAVIVETIQGESGVHPVNDDFLKAVREACDRVDALLILDEVQCGLGRTGKVFAFENTSVKPDVLCVAKPLGLGVPLGAFLVAEKAVEGLKAGDHGRLSAAARSPAEPRIYADS